MKDKKKVLLQKKDKSWTEIPIALLTRKKSRHNFWIDGLEKGTSFFGYIFSLGFGLFYAVTFLTLVYFWLEYYTSNINTPLLANFALTFLLILKLCGFLIIFGLIFKYFCYYLSIFLSHKEEKKLLEVGKKKYGFNSR
jgi:hypothetical protein